MKIVAIDVRGTHSDPALATMLEFGAVGFDTSLEYEPVFFHKRFVPNKTFKSDLISTVANIQLFKGADLYSNNKLLSRDQQSYDTPVDNLVEAFFKWAGDNQLLYSSKSTLHYINVAGYDFNRFALPLLEKNSESWKMLLGKRSIEISSLYSESEDTEFPDIHTCNIRASLIEPAAVDALKRANNIGLLTHNKLFK